MLLCRMLWHVAPSQLIRRYLGLGRCLSMSYHEISLVCMVHRAVIASYRARLSSRRQRKSLVRLGSIEGKQVKPPGGRKVGREVLR